MKSGLTLEDENSPAPEVTLLVWLCIHSPSFFLFSFFSSLFLCSDHSEKVSIQKAIITSIAVSERVLISEKGLGNVCFEDSIAPALSRQIPSLLQLRSCSRTQAGLFLALFVLAGKKQGGKEGHRCLNKANMCCHARHPRCIRLPFLLPSASYLYHGQLLPASLPLLRPPQPIALIKSHQLWCRVIKRG